MKILIGLGNPGRRHARGRHNLGFMVLDRFAQRNNIKIIDKKYHALVGEGCSNDEKVLLVKPQSFMNRSGESLRDILRARPVTADNLIVIHDDMDLPLGRIRMRMRGSAGGHRGVISILEVLAKQDLMRIRVGIGRPPSGVDPMEYVLDPFLAEEELVLERALSTTADAVSKLLEIGPLKAMEEFNQNNE